MSVVSCPRCQISLKKVKLGLLCRQCEGCWLKFEELEAALRSTEEELIAAGLEPTLRPDSPGIDLNHTLLCPICNKSMRRFPYMVDSGILVDSCSEHGMWLDDGELQSVRTYCQVDGVTMEPEPKKGFFARLLSLFK